MGPFVPAGSAAERGELSGVATLAPKLFEVGAVFTLGPQRHGELLFKGLFSDRNLRNYLTTARATLQRPDAVMRVRLRIDRGAGELHALK
jgi:hypothetical protein